MKRTLTFACVLLGACSLFLGPEPSTSPQAIYDDLWTQFDRHYSYFELKNIDWNAQRAAFRPPDNANSSQLLASLVALVNTLDDPHVIVRNELGSFQSGQNRARQRTYYSQTTALTYVSKQRFTTSGKMRFGLLSSRIGYVRVPSFGGTGWGIEIAEALTGMEGIEAVVIDMRDNGGGDNSNSIQIANHFADERRTAGYFRYRSGPSHSDFTAPAPIEIIPVAKPFAGPVAVLCNRRCASATEDFLLRMHAIPGMLLIGDTSMGAVGNPIQRELANGWSYQLSEWMVLTPEMKPVEDAGLVPNIVLPGNAADSAAALDRPLERAVVELNARLAVSPVRRAASPP